MTHSDNLRPATAPRAADSRSQSTARRLLDFKRASSPLPAIKIDDHLKSSSIARSPHLPSAVNLATSWDRQQLSKKRSQYYGEIFAYREPHNTAKDRVTRDAVIVADIKFSGHLDVEQNFLSDFSFHLSEIYQRPESCIIVFVSSPEAMIYRGSSEPAYFMTITALASEVAPTKNKRSTALVQAFMHESLEIAPARGVLRFEAVAEENLATNGLTTLQEIEKMERNSSEDSRALSTLSTNRSKKTKGAFTPAFLERRATNTPSLTAAHEKYSAGEADGARSIETTSAREKRMKRRKSLMAFFGR